MNPIQQISLKLQLGIDPAKEIHPDDLRAMWDRVSKQQEARGKVDRAKRGFPTDPVKHIITRH